jgi:2-iminobutanoate/2-iminopropanoate deaminase
MTLRKLTNALITTGCMLFLQTAQADEVEYYVTPDSAPLNLPFSDAVVFDDLMVMSGQLGVDPATFKLVDGGIEAETHRIFSNMKSLLASHDATLDDIVKCTVMIADIGQWPAFNTIYLSYFTAHKPARSALGANGLALNAAVELECWAALDD